METATFARWFSLTALGLALCTAPSVARADFSLAPDETPPLAFHLTLSDAPATRRPFVPASLLGLEFARLDASLSLASLGSLDVLAWWPVLASPFSSQVTGLVLDSPVAVGLVLTFTLTPSLSVTLATGAAGPDETWLTGGLSGRW